MSWRDRVGTFLPFSLYFALFLSSADLRDPIGHFTLCLVRPYNKVVVSVLATNGVLNEASSVHVFFKSERRLASSSFSCQVLVTLVIVFRISIIQSVAALLAFPARYYLPAE